MNSAIDDGVNRKGLVSIFVGIFARPKATMRYLSQAHRRWWLIPVLIALIAVTAQGVVYASNNAEIYYQRELEFFESLQAEERGGMVQPPSKPPLQPLAVGVPVAGKFLGTVVTWLIWAGLLLLLGTFLGQNGAGFGAFFAMVAWAWMPLALRNLVQGLYMFATGETVYNQGLSGLVVDRAPAPITPGYRPYTMPTSGQQALAALLGRIDIYTIWYLVLIALGVMAFARFSAKRAWLGTAGIWLLLTLLSLLPSLIGFGQGLRLF